MRKVPAHHFASSAGDLHQPSNNAIVLAEFKAMEGYNGRERRAIAIKGGTDVVPIPSWMSQSQAAGRSASKLCTIDRPAFSDNHLQR